MLGWLAGRDGWEPVRVPLTGANRKGHSASDNEPYCRGLNPRYPCEPTGLPGATKEQVHAAGCEWPCPSRLTESGKLSGRSRPNGERVPPETAGERSGGLRFLRSASCTYTREALYKEVNKLYVNSEFPAAYERGQRAIDGEIRPGDRVLVTFHVFDSDEAGGETGDFTGEYIFVKISASGQRVVDEGHGWGPFPLYGLDKMDALNSFALDKLDN